MFCIAEAGNNRYGGLPAEGSGDYSTVNIYRTGPNGNNFFLLGSTAAGGTYSDNGSTPLSAQPLNDNSLSGNYTYMVTFHRAGEKESRPSVLIGPQNVVNGRVTLSNLSLIHI